MGVRTVTSSVILRTSFPSEDLHFMVYRVFQTVSPKVRHSRACRDGRARGDRLRKMGIPFWVSWHTGFQRLLDTVATN